MDALNNPLFIPYYYIHAREGKSINVCKRPKENYLTRPFGFLSVKKNENYPLQKRHSKIIL